MAQKACFGVVLGLVMAFLVGRVLGFRFQLTPSLPYGIYRAVPYGDGARMVGFCPTWPVKHRTWGGCPDGYAELQKPVIGAPGDEITLSPQGIALDGKLLPNTAPCATDRDGRPLKHYPYGNYLVQWGELWTVSTHNPRSYDSRYYGPIPASIVKEEVEPLWTW